MPADILDQLRTERAKYSDDTSNVELIESLDLILDKASSSSQALSVLNSIVASMNGNGRALNENIHDICKSFKIYDRIASRAAARTSGLSHEFKDLGYYGKDSISIINSELKTSLSLLSLVRKSVEKYGDALEGIHSGKDSKGIRLEIPKKERSSFDRITKFSSGGKIGGSKKTGDNYIARLNAGEEILKQEQARRIKQQLIEKQLNEKKLRFAQKRLQDQKKINDHSKRMIIDQKTKHDIISESNLQKFASGGEIKNGPRSGDRKIIRVNAGEWVLTQNQMKTLGSKLGLKSPSDVFRAAGGSPFRKSFSSDGIRKFGFGGESGDSLESNVLSNLLSNLYFNFKGFNNRLDYITSEFSPYGKRIVKAITDINVGREKIYQMVKEELRNVKNDVEKANGLIKQDIQSNRNKMKAVEDQISSVDKALKEAKKPSKERKEREELFAQAKKKGTEEEQRQAKDYLDENTYEKTVGSAEEIKRLEKQKDLLLEQKNGLQKEIKKLRSKEKDTSKEIKRASAEFIKAFKVGMKERRTREKYSDENLPKLIEERQKKNWIEQSISGEFLSERAKALMNISIEYDTRAEKNKNLGGLGDEEERDEMDTNSEISFIAKKLSDLHSRKESGEFSESIFKLPKLEENLESIIEEYRSVNDEIKNINSQLNEEIDIRKRDELISTLEDLEDKKSKIREKVSESKEEVEIISNAKGGLNIGNFKDIFSGIKKISSSKIGQIPIGKAISGPISYLGDAFSGAASKLMPIVGQLQAVYDATKMLVKAIEGMYRQLADVIQLDIKSAQAAKVLNLKAGNGAAETFERSFDLTKSELIRLAPEIKEAIRSGLNMEQITKISENIKNAMGELDSDMFNRAMNATKGMSEGELNVLMSGDLTSENAANLLAGLSANGTTGDIADLMELGVFGEGKGVDISDLQDQGVSGGDKKIITELRVITKMIEDFKHSATKLLEGPLKILFALVIEPIKTILDLINPMLDELSDVGAVIGAGIKLIMKQVLVVTKAITDIFGKLDSLGLGSIASSLENLSDSIDQGYNEYISPIIDILTKILNAIPGVGGALKGAAIGAAVGSIIPGVGTLSGAIFGGIVGFIGNLIDDKMNAAKSGNRERFLQQKRQLEILDNSQKYLKRISSGIYSKNSSDAANLYFANMSGANSSYGNNSSIKSNLSSALANESKALSEDFKELGNVAKAFSKLEGEIRLRAIKDFISEQEKIQQKHAQKMSQIINEFKASIKFQQDIKSNLNAGKSGDVSSGDISGYANAMAQAAIGAAGRSQNNIGYLDKQFNDMIYNSKKNSRKLIMTLSDQVSPEQRNDVLEYSERQLDLSRAKRDALADPENKEKINIASRLEKEVSQMYYSLKANMSEADLLILEGINKSAIAINEVGQVYAQARNETKSAIFNALQELKDLSDSWRFGFAGSTIESMEKSILTSFRIEMKNLSVSQVSKAADAGIATAHAKAKIARKANNDAYEASIKFFNEQQNEKRGLLKNAEGLERIKIEKEIMQIELSKKELAQNAAAKEKEIKLEEMEAIKAAAEEEYQVKEKIVDLAQQQYDIQADLLQAVGAPMETIMDLEKQRIGLVEAQLDNAKEYYNRLKESGASEMELRQASLNVQKQESAVVKARLGAQRGIMEKIFGNMIGAFTEVAGIIGPNKDSDARKFGMGYVQYGDGTVGRGGKKTGGYRDRLFASGAIRKDLFDETNGNVEDSNASFETNILNDLTDISSILNEIKKLFGEEKETKNKEKEKEIAEIKSKIDNTNDKIVIMKDFMTQYKGKLREVSTFGSVDETVAEKIVNDKKYRNEYLEKIKDQRAELESTTRNQIRGRLFNSTRRYLEGDLLEKETDKEMEMISSRISDIKNQENLISKMGDYTAEEAITENSHYSKIMRLIENKNVDMEEASIRESYKPHQYSDSSNNSSMQIEVKVGVDEKNGSLQPYVSNAMDKKWNSDGRKMMNSQLNNGAALN